MKILIVDDNTKMRQLIKSLIGDLADEFFECEDGISARAAYAAHQPDFTLMDYEMKQMDGVTATREIKASFPEARIIMVSTYKDQGYRDAAQAAGACAYVVKEDLFELRGQLIALNNALNRS